MAISFSAPRTMVTNGNGQTKLKVELLTLNLLHDYVWN